MSEKEGKEEGLLLKGLHYPHLRLGVVGIPEVKSPEHDFINNFNLGAARFFVPKGSDTRKQNTRMGNEVSVRDVLYAAAKKKRE